MLRWQPGATLLSAFDIKIGRLSASVRKQTLTESDIARACQKADDAISYIMRKDHESDHDIITREEMVELTEAHLNQSNVRLFAGLEFSSWKGLTDTQKQPGAIS